MDIACAGQVRPMPTVAPASGLLFLEVEEPESRERGTGPLSSSSDPVREPGEFRGDPHRFGSHGIDVSPESGLTRTGRLLGAAFSEGSGSARSTARGRVSVQRLCMITDATCLEMATTTTPSVANAAGGSSRWSSTGRMTRSARRGGDSRRASSGEQLAEPILIGVFINQGKGGGAEHFPDSE